MKWKLIGEHFATAVAYIQPLHSFLEMNRNASCPFLFTTTYYVSLFPSLGKNHTAFVDTWAHIRCLKVILRNKRITTFVRNVLLIEFKNVYVLRCQLFVWLIAWNCKIVKLFSMAHSGWALSTEHCALVKSCYHYVLYVFSVIQNLSPLFGFSFNWTFSQICAFCLNWYWILNMCIWWFWNRHKWHKKHFSICSTRIG